METWICIFKDGLQIRIDEAVANTLSMIEDTPVLVQVTDKEGKLIIALDPNNILCITTESSIRQSY